MDDNSISVLNDVMFDSGHAHLYSSASLHSNDNCDFSNFQEADDYEKNKVICSNPVLLMMSVYNLRIGTSNYIKSVLHQESSRAIDVQQFIRNRNVEKYQEQINKAIEGDNIEHISKFFTGLFDSLISLFEIGMGALKILEGIALCNPLDIASGSAYLIAGTFGMIKTLAEFAQECGADKEACAAVINFSGKVRSLFECIGLCLDVFQIGRAFTVSRSAASALEKTLASDLSEELSQAIISGSEETVYSLSENISESIINDVSSKFNFLEREAAALEEIQSETMKKIMDGGVIKKMTSCLGDRFSRDVMKNTLKHAIEETSMRMIEKGDSVIGKSLGRTITDAFTHNIKGKILLRTNKFFTYQTRFILCQQVLANIFAIKSAFLQKDIDQLVAFREYNESSINDIDKAKKEQFSLLTASLKSDSNDFNKLFDVMKEIFIVKNRVVSF